MPRGALIGYDMSVQDIADTLGITRKSTSRILCRALNKIRGWESEPRVKLLRTYLDGLNEEELLHLPQVEAGYTGFHSTPPVTISEYELDAVIEQFD